MHPPDRRVADAASGAVDPVEAGVLDVPHRTFAEMIAALENAVDP
jgi:hypothetical protein